MDIERQLEEALGTNHLVFVVFYADWSPRYECMQVIAVGSVFEIDA